MPAKRRIFFQYENHRSRFIRRYFSAAALISPHSSAPGISFNLYRQFPSPVPGVFIRASLPSRNQSCMGTIAVSARDPYNEHIIALLMSPHLRGKR